MINAVPQYVKRRTRRFWPWTPAPTYDAPLQPEGYARIVLPPGGFSRVTELTAPFNVPPSSDRFVLNVEGFAVRYLDCGVDAGSQYGELIPAGSSFYRAVDPNMITLATDATNGGNAVVNISFYSLPDGSA